MTFVRMDDHFPQHPKALALEDAAFAMHVRAICYCSTQLSDGLVRSGALPLLTRHRKPLSLVAALVKEGLWEPQEDGWIIHDYLDWQESRASVLAKREAARERMSRRRSPEVRPNIARTSGELREQETETETEKNKSMPTAPQIGAPDDGFEAWWQTYPTPAIGTKPDKAGCRKRWARLSKADRAAAEVGLRHYVAAIGASGTPAKYPATWLNGRVWEDFQEPVTPAPQAASPPKANGWHPPEPSRPKLQTWEEMEAERRQAEAEIAAVQRG